MQRNHSLFGNVWSNMRRGHAGPSSRQRPTETSPLKVLLHLSTLIIIIIIIVVAHAHRINSNECLNGKHQLYLKINAITLMIFEWNCSCRLRSFWRTPQMAKTDLGHHQTSTFGKMIAMLYHSASLIRPTITAVWRKIFIIIIIIITTIITITITIVIITIIICIVWNWNVHYETWSNDGKINSHTAYRISRRKFIR